MKKLSLLLGGLLVLFFITQKSFAYDQPNTHPALTKAAGEFFKLKFSQKKKKQKKKKNFIKKN